MKAYYGGKELKIMSSVYYGGSIRMNPEPEMLDRDPMFEGGYPHKVPKVYLEGHGEAPMSSRECRRCPRREGSTPRGR